MRTSTLVLLALLASLFPTSVQAQSCTIADDFDAGIKPLWLLSDPATVISVDGFLDMEFSGPPELTHYAQLSDCFYSDFEVRFRCRDLDSTKGKVFGFRTTGPLQVGYGVNFLSSPTNKVLLAKGVLGDRVELISAPLLHDTGEWLDVYISVIGGSILVEVNGAPVLAYTDPNPLPAGAAMLTINAGGNLHAHSQWDDFVIDAFDAIPTEVESWSTIKSRY